ncbi:CvpA family protein [Rhizobium sp. S9]|uniref:CvpA family protein n=1 Tax=Rhizobium sp. S9 TaxID=2035454 RepID=UPI001FDFDC6F|nr:CvpA family protein [Rhizobium sp. S9]
MRKRDAARKQKGGCVVTDRHTQERFPCEESSRNRSKMMDTATHWALLLGILTLASWLAGGFAAVLGNVELGHHGQRAAEYLSFGLSVAGFISAVAMVLILVIR